MEGKAKPHKKRQDTVHFSFVWKPGHDNLVSEGGSCCFDNEDSQTQDDLG